MNKLVVTIEKDNARGCSDHYYGEITVESFTDRGFDYLLKQEDDVIALTEKQMFNLYEQLYRLYNK